MPQKIQTQTHQTTLEEVGKKVWEKEIPILDNLQPIKSTLHQYLAWFNDFVEKTEQKIIQLRITSQQKSILIEVYSFNGASSQLIQKKFIEFLKISGEEDWQKAKKYITSQGQPLNDALVEYAIANQKQMMDFMIKSKELEVKKEGQLLQFLQEFSRNQKPNLELNYHSKNTQEQNSNYQIQTLNGKIENLLKKEKDENLKQEIQNLKQEFLNSNLEDQEKQEALLDLQEFLQDLEKAKDSKKPEEKQNLTQKINRTLRSLSSFAVEIGKPILVEVIKKQLGL